MGGAEFPPCWLFVLRWPNTGAYRLFGGANGRLQAGSCQGILPRTSATSVSVPAVSHSYPPPTSAGDPPTPVGRSSSVSHRVTAPSCWVPMHTAPCVQPPRVESPLPPVLSKSFNQILLALKVRFSGNSFPRCQTPRLVSPTWGPEPSLQWVDLCGTTVLQFVGHPRSGHGTWFHCDCTTPIISLQPLPCPWMWGVFLGEFQCLPVNDYPAGSCDSDALARGSERLLLHHLEPTTPHLLIGEFSPFTFKVSLIDMYLLPFC